MNILALLLTAALATTDSGSSQPARVVDFRFAPVSTFSTICLPGDWLKTVVTDRGGLGYDFGPGPYARPLTEVDVTIRDTSLPVQHQTCADPRVPIAITEFASEISSLTLRTFSLVDPRSPVPEIALFDGRFERLGDKTGTEAWADPDGPIGHLLRDVAWGVNRPIRYRVRVGRGDSARVVLAVVEPYKPKAGMRILLARVEGAPPAEIDPLAEAPRNTPVLRLFDARDADLDGWLQIEMAASPRSPDPNVILAGFWLFPAGVDLDLSLMREGTIPDGGSFFRCGPDQERAAETARVDGIIAECKGGEPIVTIRTSRPLRFDPDPGVMTSDEGRPFLFTRPSPVSASKNGRVWTLSFPPGTRRLEVVTLHGPAGISTLSSVPPLDEAMQRAGEFWLSTREIPSRSILIPDSGLQYVVDASVRTLYQVADRVDGLLQFQPGPSVYRGLWVTDANRQIDAALTLGDTASARMTIDLILRNQQPDGRIAVMAPYPMHRETPCLVYIACRYARLSGDTSWLRTRWPALMKGLEWLWRLRQSTHADSSAPFAGLFPPAFADGGLGGLNAEYGSVVWALIAFKEASRTARWIGKTDDAARWEQAEAELLQSFRTAAARDRKRDAYGNLYLPITVADTSTTRPPAVAQWFLLMGVLNGRVFSAEDPLVLGTLAMLDAQSSQGLPLNTGWLADGIWAWFAPYPGIAHIEAGHFNRATDMLYAFANHATPLGTWVEEQLPRHVGTKTSGDASNASGSALFLSFLRRFLIREDEHGITLLPVLPEEWIRPGARLKLDGVLSEFGPVFLDLNVSGDMSRISVSLAPLSGMHSGGSPAVNLRTFKELGYRWPDGTPLPESIAGTWGKVKTLTMIR